VAARADEAAAPVDDPEAAEMSSPDDRPREPEDEAAAHEQTPPHETESRLDHVDVDDYLTPDEAREEQPDKP
jgi:hypothetical protein